MPELLQQAIAGVGKNLLQRAGLRDAAAPQENHAGGRFPNLGQIVRDVKNAHVECSQARQDVMGSGVVQSRQRFVQKQQSRSGRQCASQRHPLPLAAGQASRLSLFQVFRSKQVEHFADPASAFIAAEMANSESDVLMHTQVRKERGLLCDETDVPAARGHEDIALGVEQSLPFHHNPSMVRAGEPGENAEDAALTGA